MSRPRRDLLRTMAAALGPVSAGCASSRESDAPTETTTDSDGLTRTKTARRETMETPTTEVSTTATPTTLRQVSVDDVSPAPEEAELSFGVQMVESAVTTESTAVVRVTVTNEASELRRVGAGHRPAFSAVYSEEDRPGLALLDPASDLEVPNDYERVAPDCWRPDANVAVAGVTRQVALGPDESESLDVEVWGSPLNEEACLEPGTYRFRDGYEVDDPVDPTSVATVEWGGFGLHVESL